MKKWKIKNLRNQRPRRQNPPQVQAERTGYTTTKDELSLSESWINQLRHSFQEETPKDWLPAPYQALFDHTVSRKMGG